jgi:hypothetical protein
LESSPDFCEWNDDDALFTLPLVSRTIEGAIHPKWLRTYFTCRYVDLAPAKLAELRNVSAMSDVSNVTTTIQIRCTNDSEAFKSRRERPGDDEVLFLDGGGTVELQKNNDLRISSLRG